METQYFKTLMAVVKTASFSRAASELCITQSAVSQRIKFMEDRYGHQLLDRTGPLLTASLAGRIVIDRAERMLQLEREIADELAKIGGNKRLSLCCTPTFGIVYLPQVLSNFLSYHSESIDLKFIFSTPDQAIKGLTNNEFDLAVIEHCDQMDLSDFTTFSLPKDELIFITAPQTGDFGDTIDLEVLLQQRLVTRKEGCSSRRRLELNLQALGHSLSSFRSMVVFDDLRLTIQAIISGGGVAFVSRSLVQEHLATGTLREHHVNGFCHLRHRTVAVNRNRGIPELIEGFLEGVNKVFYSPEKTPHSCLVSSIKRNQLELDIRKD